MIIIFPIQLFFWGIYDINSGLYEDFTLLHRVLLLIGSCLLIDISLWLLLVILNTHRIIAIFSGKDTATKSPLYFARLVLIFHVFFFKTMNYFKKSYPPILYYGVEKIHKRGIGQNLIKSLYFTAGTFLLSFQFATYMPETNIPHLMFTQVFTLVILATIPLSFLFVGIDMIGRARIYFLDPDDALQNRVDIFWNSYIGRAIAVLGLYAALSMVDLFGQHYSAHDYRNLSIFFIIFLFFNSWVLITHEHTIETDTADIRTWCVEKNYFNEDSLFIHQKMEEIGMYLQGMHHNPDYDEDISGILAALEELQP
ncbi:MAG: hypothetical protein ACTSYA_05885 [Candidatus Kariarchaeaceae archaeon]